MSALLDGVLVPVSGALTSQKAYRDEVCEFLSKPRLAARTPLASASHAARTPPPARAMRLVRPPPARASRPVPPWPARPRGSYAPASASHAARTPRPARATRLVHPRQREPRGRYSLRGRRAFRAHAIHRASVHTVRRAVDPSTQPVGCSSLARADLAALMPAPLIRLGHSSSSPSELGPGTAFHGSPRVATQVGSTEPWG